MFIWSQQSYCINSHDFHWGCRSASLIEGALPCDPPTVGVMGVRKQSMNRRCLQLARWRLEYNPLWGEGVLAGPLHSALMWAPFNFLSIFLLIFEQRFPHFSMEEFWRKLPTMMIITIEWKMPKNGKIKLISIENACISTNSKPKLSTVVNFGLTFITLSKSNGKQLCKKILFMKNNCGTMITTIYEIEIVTCLNLQYSTCLVSLIV